MHEDLALSVYNLTLHHFLIYMEILGFWWCLGHLLPWSSFLILSPNTVACLYFSFAKVRNPYASLPSSLSPSYISYVTQRNRANKIQLCVTTRDWRFWSLMSMTVVALQKCTCSRAIRHASFLSHSVPSEPTLLNVSSMFRVCLTHSFPWLTLQVISGHPFTTHLKVCFTNCLGFFPLNQVYNQD